ncbi:ATP-binding cassette domain-containing protein [Candidatus Dojkabacteria bacterium]|nr:ATP-binding cassette domain-containing protein [Candidatus Dojkabacteria bacterium]
MIEIKNIYKSFGPIHAVNGISLSIDKGEILGLLGPNGAGKSTTMRMITGYLFPDKGSIKIQGQDMKENSEEIQKIIGYMPENNPIYKSMLVEELLKLVLRLRQIPIDQNIIDKVVEQTGLEDVYYRPIGQLSKGYQQRVGLAQALIHDPEILILDEPTEGLDPNQRNEIRKLVRNISQEKTIIISTHVMQEVSAMCNRIVIINNGKIVADGDQKTLTNRDSEIVEFSAEGKNIEEQLKKIQTVKIVKKIESQNNIELFELATKADKNFYKELGEITAANRWIVYKINEKVDSLEDVFYSLTKENN